MSVTPAGWGILCVLVGTAACVVRAGLTMRRDSERAGRTLELIALATRRGHPLPRVLFRAAAEVRGRDRDALISVAHWLEAGHGLAEALGRGAWRWFDAPTLAAIAAAEGGPHLPDVLDRLGSDAVVARAQRYRFAMAASYPGLLAVVLFGVHHMTDRAIGIVWRVRPGSEAGAPLSGIVGLAVPGLVALAALLLVAAWWQGPGPVPALARWRDRVVRRVPWVGPHLRLLGLARALRAASLQMLAGLPMPHALRRAAACANDGRTQNALRAAADALEVGTAPSDAWPCRLLPDFVRQRLGAGDGGPDLPARMRHLAEQCERRANLGLARASSLLQPCAVGAVAAVLGLAFARLQAVLDAARWSAMEQMPW